MRNFCGALIVVLLLIAVAGMGAGVWLVSQSNERNFPATIGLGIVPFTIGTIALVGAVISILLDELLKQSEITNTLLRMQLPEDEKS